jgi:hypothetical protein
MLDGIVVKIVNSKKSVQMIVCYFIVKTLVWLNSSAFIIRGYGVVSCPKIL